MPDEWLPPAFESTVIGGAGDQAAGALGVGIVEPGPVSVVLGTSGVVFAVLPGYAADPQARVHVFCHAVPGTWHAMGVMLSAAGSLALAPRTSSAARSAELDARGRALAARGRGAPVRAVPPGRAHAARRPGRRAARSPGSRSATTAARSRGRCSRASPTGCATRSSCCARSASQPSVGRVSGGGSRSDLWLRIVASVLDLPLERTESDAGAAFGAALLAGVREGVFADAAEAVARCVRVARTRRARPGVGRRPTPRGTSASATSTRG